MGYSTNYKGELRFARELTTSELRAVKAMLGEDIREHKDWPADPKDYLTYIDLKLTDDFGGLQWDGSEKTSPMDGLVNVLTDQLRKTIPDFRLTGEMLAHGEDSEDVWRCVIDESGRASRQDVVLTGTKTKCPECGHKFRVTA